MWDERRWNRCIMHVISVMVVGIVPTFVAFQFILMHLWRGYKQNSTKAKDKCGEESYFPHSYPHLIQGTQHNTNLKILHPTSPNHSFFYFHPNLTSHTLLINSIPTTFHALMFKRITISLVSQLLG